MNDQRNERGQFAKGNKLGKGRPRLIRPTLPELPLEDMKHIVAIAIEQAQDGDHEARMWLLQYEEFRINYVATQYPQDDQDQRSEDQHNEHA